MFYIFNSVPEKVPPASMSLLKGFVQRELMQDITDKA